MIYIYALLCPKAGMAVRYIGKSKDPDRRLREHLRSARNPKVQHRCARWLRSLLAENLLPTMELIYVVPDGEDWQVAEARFIAQYRSVGAPLTNLTAGGEGWKEGDPEILERMRESLRRTMSTPEMKEISRKRAEAMFRDPVIRRKHAESRVAYLSAPAVREKMASDSRARAARPGVREAMSEAATAAWDRIRAERPEDVRAMREQRSRVQKARYADPELRAAALGALHSPEAKEKRYRNRDSSPEKVDARREKLRAAWADPERRARRLAVMQSPEYKAKIAQRSREMHARRKAEQPQL